MRDTQARMVSEWEKKTEKQFRNNGLRTESWPEKKGGKAW